MSSEASESPTTVPQPPSIDATATARAAYEERKEVRAQQAQAFEQRETKTGYIRFATALVAIALGITAYQSPSMSGNWVWLPVIAFFALLIWQSHLGRQRKRAEAKARYWQQGLDRMADRWHGQGPSGQRFLAEDHLYARDLDLFGDGGLFQLLCQARTPEGETRLADWLRAGADAETVAARQEAAAELAGALDLRESLAAASDAQKGDLNASALRDWVAEPAVDWPRRRIRASRATMVILAAAFAVIMPLAFSGRISGLYLGAILFVELSFMTRLKPYMERVGAQISARLAQLEALGRILAVVQGRSFSSPLLQKITKRLSAEGMTAAARTRQVGRLVSMFDTSRNQMLIPIAFPLFWPHHFAISLERWRLAHGPTVLAWLDAVADLEALLSLAAFAYEHPDYSTPKLSSAPPHLLGEALGHPLLPRKTRVCNDVALGAGSPDTARLVLISGSNMSGKSTYLRTVGINTVLAQAGAVVCAARFALSPVRVGATLNIHDSLAEGKSRFYAEITRIKAIVALTEDTKAPPVLFLFDEILHGTNSDDRQTGATAVMKGLLKRHTLGFVTTHDLALTRMAQEIEGGVRNMHLQDQMVDDVMTFDYQIRPGVVTRSNALALMRAVGLEV